MNCIIIEDQPPAQRILKRYMADVEDLNLIGTFSNVIEPISLIQSGKVDLIFLDIHLPKMSGIDFLKSTNNLPPVILTTAFADFALESYELDVVDYLLKPFSFPRFIKAISKVPTSADLAEPGPVQTPAEIFIKSGYELIRVLVADISYIKADGDYTEIFTSAKKYLSQDSLKHWLETLTQNHFIRTHKSYIINLQKVHKVSGGQVVLMGEERIPIGRAYKEGFEERLRRS